MGSPNPNPKNYNPYDRTPKRIPDLWKASCVAWCMVSYGMYTYIYITLNPQTVFKTGIHEITQGLSCRLKDLHPSGSKYPKP